MSITVDQIIEDILKAEGGYVNDPADKGGETNHGLTIKVARENKYFGDMKDLPRDVAKDIYLKQYFIDNGFDKVYNISPKIGAELTDTGVNCGPSFARPLLQKALNILNRDSKDYAELVEDGIIGAATILAFKTFLKDRGAEGEKVMLKILNVMQGARYLDIVQKNKTQRKFAYGWFSARIEL